MTDNDYWRALSWLSLCHWSHKWDLAIIALFVSFFFRLEMDGVVATNISECHILTIKILYCPYHWEFCFVACIFMDDNLCIRFKLWLKSPYTRVGVDQKKAHYLNLWCTSLVTHICQQGLMVSQSVSVVFGFVDTEFKLRKTRRVIQHLFICFALIYRSISNNEEC